MDETTKQAIKDFTMQELRRGASSLAMVLVAHGAVAASQQAAFIQIVVGLAWYGLMMGYGWYLSQGRAKLAAAWEKFSSHPAIAAAAAKQDVTVPPTATAK